MDAQRIERQVFDSYGFTSNKFREVFFLDTSSDKFGQLNYTVSATNETAYYMHRNVVERCRNDVALRNLMEEEYEQLLRDREQLRYTACHTQIFTLITSHHSPLHSYTVSHYITLTTRLLHCISSHNIISQCHHTTSPSSHLISPHLTPSPISYHRVIMGCRGSGSESDPFTYLPVNIDRLIWNAQRQFRIKMQEPTSLDPRVRNLILNMHTMTLIVLCHELAFVILIVIVVLKEDGKKPTL